MLNENSKSQYHLTLITILFYNKKVIFLNKSHKLIYFLDRVLM